MSGVDLAEYFNGGSQKDLSSLPLPSPPSDASTTPTASAGGVGLRRSSSTAGLAGEAGASLGRTTSGWGEGLRRRANVGGAGGSADANGFEGGPASTRKGGEGGGGATAGPGADHLPPETSGGKEVDESAGTMSTGALVGVFKGMMKERLILVTFVLQAVRPAQDLAPLVALKFSGGASVLAGITSSRSLCRVLVPMTPLIPWLVRLAGGSSSAGATAKMGGDRAVAALMCVLMAGLVACVPAVGTLRELHHLMAFNGLCYIVRESTAGAVMARAAGTASVGAFFGWQHCIKGIQGTFSHFLTGWLSGHSISLPYYVVAICDLLYAFTYLYI